MKKFWIGIITIFMAIIFIQTSHAASFTEAGVGGDVSTGAITVVLSREKSLAGVSTGVNISYATYDASGVLIRTGAIKLDYNTFTTEQKTAIDNIITKAISAVKTQTSIP